MRGWISLQKQIRNHWLWEDPKYLKAWLDMLMMANYSEVKKPYKDQIVTIKRGEFPSSYRNPLLATVRELLLVQTLLS